MRRVPKNIFKKSESPFVEILLCFTSDSRILKWKYGRTLGDDHNKKYSKSIFLFDKKAWKFKQKVWNLYIFENSFSFSIEWNFCLLWKTYKLKSFCMVYTQELINNICILHTEGLYWQGLNKCNLSRYARYCLW